MYGWPTRLSNPPRDPASERIFRLSIKFLTSDKPFGTINLLQTNGWTKIKIWHPNFSGMQFDQLTRTEIPAEYIESVQLFVEDKLVWEYNGTIGIAQDVFFMMPIHTEGKHVVVFARDNLGNEFEYDNTY